MSMQTTRASSPVKHELRSSKHENIQKKSQLNKYLRSHNNYFGLISSLLVWCILSFTAKTEFPWICKSLCNIVFSESLYTNNNKLVLREFYLCIQIVIITLTKVKQFDYKQQVLKAAAPACFMKRIPLALCQHIIKNWKRYSQPADSLGGSDVQSPPEAQSLVSWAYGALWCSGTDHPEPEGFWWRLCQTELKQVHP